MLAGAGIGGLYDLVSFLRGIVPRAETALQEVRARAEAIPNDELRNLALGSIEHKAYHVAGGCILATFLTPAAADHYVEIVAPLETIYDYLDSLCDRHSNSNADAYPVLHRAIADALEPAAREYEYYGAGPHGDDGDYLVTLVRRVQRSLRRLADHELLFPCARKAAALYARMQTLVHLPKGEREERCKAWYSEHEALYPNLEWQEFACAAGSQLHVYAPLFTIFESRCDAVEQTHDAYFPYVSALHVLFDSFIDQEEDLRHGDLNFVSAYPNGHALRERVAYLTRQAVRSLRRLIAPERHLFVLRVMALFYLTHPKVYAQGLEPEARALLRIIDALLEA